MSRQNNTEKTYIIANERYAEYSVDTDEAMEKSSKIAISIHSNIQVLCGTCNR